MTAPHFQSLHHTRHLSAMNHQHECLTDHSEVLKHATRGDVKRAAKAAAEMAKYQAQPVTDAVGQATRDTAQSASSISDVLQGMLLLLLNLLTLCCFARTQKLFHSLPKGTLQAVHRMLKHCSVKHNLGLSTQVAKHISKQTMLCLKIQLSAVLTVFRQPHCKQFSSHPRL